MENWRKAWRDGFAPMMSTEALEALRVALANDDCRLMQGQTTSPPPLQCVQDWPCEGACLIGYAGASELGGVFPRHQVIEQGHPCATVGEVEEFFARACFVADMALGESGGCRWLLNWFDETPRDEMIRELLPEVVLALHGREGYGGEDHMGAAVDNALDLDRDVEGDFGGGESRPPKAQRAV